MAHEVTLLLGIEHVERFGEQRVIGIGERALRDGPRFIPAEARFVEQDVHVPRWPLWGGCR